MSDTPTEARDMDPQVLVLLERACREERWLGPNEASPSAAIVAHQLKTLKAAGFRIVRDKPQPDAEQVIEQAIQTWPSDSETKLTTEIAYIAAALNAAGLLKGRDDV